MVFTASNPFKEYFKELVEFMGKIGVWIPDPEIPWRNKLKQYWINVVCMGFTWLWVFPSELMEFRVIEDSTSLITVSRNNLNYIFLFMKYLNYLLVRKRLSVVIKKLQGDDFCYDESENFKPSEIAQSYLKESRQWRKASLFLILATSLSLFVSGIIIFVVFGSSLYETTDGVEVYKQDLPFPSWTPFGRGTRLKYMYILTMKSLAIYFLAITALCVDSCLTHTLSCISAHLKVLEGAFRTMRIRCIRRLDIQSALENVILDPIQLQNEMNAEMRKCIAHLHLIYWTAGQIENVYNKQALLQILLSLAGICFCFYVLQESDLTGNALQLCYFAASSFQVLTYCWFADAITQASIDLRNGVYESDWYSTSLSHKRAIIFTMTRLTRPVFITLGKFGPLTFATYLTIMRTAYSGYTVLSQTTAH